MASSLTWPSAVISTALATTAARRAASASSVTFSLLRAADAFSVVRLLLVGSAWKPALFLPAGMACSYSPCTRGGRGGPGRCRAVEAEGSLSL